MVIGGEYVEEGGHHRGSNCVPAQLRSSAIALSAGRAWA